MTEAGQCPGCGAPRIRPDEPCPHCVLARAERNPDEPDLGPGFLDDLPAAGDVLIIADKYEVKRILGRGGMGVVYLAWQETLNRVVALKMLTSVHHANPEARQRFIAEAKAVAALRHPHIVTIYDWGEDAGLPYFSMEYVEGQDLGAKTRHGPLDPKQAAQLTRKVALAVAYANDHGIIHRDLKPSNVLIGQDGEPKVVDFGLAKHLDAAAGFSVTGQVLGTLVSLAPEQIDSRVGAVDARTDVYGLGALLYHLLTGRPPFPPGASNAETLRLVAETEPVPLRRLNPSLPRDLETICLKCLAKDPTRRYASAGDFAEDLGRWGRGEPIQARPVSTAERVWSWARRKPALAVLSLGIFLAVFGAAIGLVWGWRTSVAAARHARVALAVQSALAVMRGSETPIDGWSRLVELQLRDAARLGSVGDCRDPILAWMEGLDATRVASLLATNMARVYLPAGDGGLLFVDSGGGVHWKAGPPDSGDEWSERTLPAARIALPSQVPFALLCDDDRQPVLWDLLHHREQARFELPDDLRIAATDTGIPVATSVDGSIVLVALTSRAGHALLGSFTRESKRLTASINLKVAPTALALSADGVWAATGDHDGGIQVWDLRTGTLVRELGLGSAGIACLEFGTSVRRQDRPDEPPTGRAGTPLPAAFGALGTARPTLEGGFTATGQVRRREDTSYYLAAGDESGTIGIWDLARPRQLALCRGTPYRASALAFSPDHTTLASAGHHGARLWDIATGRCLLRIEAGSQERALMFSRDGKHLVVTAQSWGTPPGVSVWELRPDRGLQTLRGLSTGVTKVAFSPDGTRLAAVSIDWEVGVWDRATGWLLHVFQGSRGLTADNCALAFDPSGRLLAFSAGEAAQLWELDSGSLRAAWSLPPGLVDVIAYPRSNALYLLRFEAVDPRGPVPTNPLAFERPALGRLRNLIRTNPTEPILEIPELDQSCFRADVSADGAFFAVDGMGSQIGRSLVTIDIDSLGLVWRTNGLHRRSWGALRFTSKGATLAYSLDGTNWLTSDLHNPRPVPLAMQVPAALGPDLSIAAAHYSRDKVTRGVRVHFGPETTLDLLPRDHPTHLPRFDASGNTVAWGTLAGSVVVCDIPRALRQLEEFGHGRSAPPPR